MFGIPGPFEMMIVGASFILFGGMALAVAFIAWQYLSGAYWKRISTIVREEIKASRAADGNAGSSARAEARSR